MKKTFTIASLFILSLISQNTFAQKKDPVDGITYKSDVITRNSKENTVTLNGNVMIKTKNFTLSNADEAFIDEKNYTITISNPKDFKLISAKALSKKGESNKNMIVYNFKEESITFQ